jgi:hypothetical protein
VHVDAKKADFRMMSVVEPQKSLAVKPPDLYDINIALKKELGKIYDHFLFL